MNPQSTVIGDRGTGIGDSVSCRRNRTHSPLAGGTAVDYILYAGLTFDYLGTTDVGSDNFPDELTTMSAYVFISYSSKDREYADLIAMALKTIGLKVWWDADLLAGQTFDEQIADALGKASAVIAVISQNSSRSPWTLNEWRYARNAGLPIFPVLIGASISAIPLNLRDLDAFVFDIKDPHKSAVDLAYQIHKSFGEIPQPSSEVIDEARRKLAASAAITAREVSKVPSDDVGKVVPDSVFLVHGHDEDMLCKLSEERVFVFHKPPPITEKLLGRFELPSDLSGKIFEDFSDDWRKILRERLEQAGFKIDKEQSSKLSKSNFS